MKKEYVELGKCIFCGKDKTETTFNKKPHILPKSMDGEIIGFDICDQCNSYFGASDELIPTPPKLAIELCVKEVMNIARYFYYKGQNKTWLKSIFFKYEESKGVLKLKNNQWEKKEFQLLFMRQFKRGIFELFLQAYHFETKQGLDSRFDNIRNFSRYNQGDARLFYVENRGANLISEVKTPPKFYMTKKCLDDINQFGFYSLYLNGHHFYLEVIPQSDENRDKFLNSECEKLSIGGPLLKDIIEPMYVNELDFTLRNLYGDSISLETEKSIIPD